MTAFLVIVIVIVGARLAERFWHSGSRDGQDRGGETAKIEAAKVKKAAESSGSDADEGVGPSQGGGSYENGDLESGDAWAAGTLRQTIILTLPARPG